MAGSWPRTMPPMSGGSSRRQQRSHERARFVGVSLRHRRSHGGRIGQRSPVGTDQFEAYMKSGPLDQIVFGPEGFNSKIAFFAFAETVPAGTSVDVSSARASGPPTIQVNRSPSRSMVSRADSMSAV